MGQHPFEGQRAAGGSRSPLPRSEGQQSPASGSRPEQHVGLRGHLAPQDPGDLHASSEDAFGSDPEDHIHKRNRSTRQIRKGFTMSSAGFFLPNAYFFLSFFFPNAYF